MENMENLREAFRIAKDPFESKYSYYGIRRQDVPFESEGEEMLHTSVIWDDGDPTEYDIDGVCALWLDAYESIEEAIKASKSYFGDYAAIIGSNFALYGEDENEIILRDPVVVAVIS